MNGFFIVLSVLVVVVLAAVALAGAIRRRDVDSAVGSLARETRQRDKSARKAEMSAVVDAPATGAEVERSAALARVGGDVAVIDEPSPPAVFVPPDPETYGVTRRQFLNRGVFALFGLGLTVFGVAIVGFLWPSSSGGFGSKIKVGSVSDLKSEIERSGGFLYKPEGRMWLTNYPSSALAKAEQVYSPAVLNSLKAGIAVLYQKCPHLGCRVPDCKSSQWFECPCHGSQYNQAGEKKGGPAPRGMDNFATEVNGGVLTVNTGQVIQGPPIGTNTTGQEAEGPNCIGAASGGHSG
ncbi:MAG: Rieske 2Fe-2S domain-containing protein [Actinobacteria bacterium]|nr:Rieske 2Fe-2S domain-containing protein [Actinomycetota bacterium]